MSPFYSGNMFRTFDSVPVFPDKWVHACWWSLGERMDGFILILRSMREQVERKTCLQDR